MIPALIVIGVGFNPTEALVLSQVFLSFGIPFALIPLWFFTCGGGLWGWLLDTCSGWGLLDQQTPS